MDSSVPLPFIHDTSNYLQKEVRQVSNLCPQTARLAQTQTPVMIFFISLLEQCNRRASKLLYYSKAMSGTLGLAALQPFLQYGTG